MWNTIYAKAKAAAQDLDKAIDKQLNENGVIEVPPSVEGTVGEPSSVDDALNDAWEDDLDDLDDEKVDAKAAEKPADEPPPAEANLTAKTEAGYKPDEMDRSQAKGALLAETTKSSLPAPASQPESSAPESAASPSKVTVPPIVNASPVATVEAVEKETPAILPDKLADVVPKQQSAPIEQAEKDVSEGAGAWEDDDGIDITENDDNETAPPVSHKAPESSAAKLAATSVAPTMEDVPLASPRGVENAVKASKAEVRSSIDSEQPATTELTGRIAQLEAQLKQREDQLFSKTEQLTTIQSMHEAEKEELRQKIQNTKEEAKKRIQKAKERVEASEGKLKQLAAVQSSSQGDAAQQAEIIAELRAEGEKLARKQADMEKAVRSAKGEARELKQFLEEEQSAKEDALHKIEKLESELKITKEDLAAARKGESQAGKLENELQQAREENERKGSTILSLEQQIKEMKATLKDLNTELEDAKKGAVIETQREQHKLRKEQSELMSDFETKLRTSEREAATREDALRHEVTELRKRWQDAVRRADALSMDIQSSSAPLLRQLESAERQSRARAAAAAEIETKLRADLEENVVANEKLTKERTELKTKCSRLERGAKENEELLKTTKAALEEKALKAKQLEDKLRDVEAESAKKQEEYAEVERLANEGVSRVRSEMTQTVVESEERYRAQIDTLQSELRREEEKRQQLEQQVQELLDNAGAIVPPNLQFSAAQISEPKKLVNSQTQEEIIVGALSGIGVDYDGYEDEEMEISQISGSNSFAVVEELSSRFKAAKIELNALRKSLSDSEKAREKLVDDLGASRFAKEKLPLFEERVKELTREVEEKDIEIQALNDDLSEVKEHFRSQLNMLLDMPAKPANGKSNPPSAVEDTVVQSSSDSDAA